MREIDGKILSIQNVRWRTIHGYVGIKNLLTNLPPGDLLKDLKSLCMDIKEINKSDYYMYNGLIPFLSDLEEEDRQTLKAKYEIIEQQLDSILKKKQFRKNKKLLKALLSQIESVFDILDTISPG